jgi:hypothetical protein
MQGAQREFNLCVHGRLYRMGQFYPHEGIPFTSPQIHFTAKGGVKILF